jgi:hypothetical protein
MTTKQNDTMNIAEWAERRVAELTADIKEYVKLGWDIEEAIDFVKSGTTLSEKYFMKVVENVFAK